METPGVTKQRIIQYLRAGKRFDGRGLHDYREIKIELGVSNKAEGSARVKIGKTEVVVGVKMDVSAPYTDSPDQGNLIITAELLPLSSERYEPGPPTMESIELARVIDRGLRESKFINLKKLCIKEGELVWNVLIDIYSINDDGNLLDASFIAAVAALRNSFIPKLREDNKVEFGTLTKTKIPLNESIPISLSFFKIDNKIVIDPTKEEEDACDVKLYVGLTYSKEGVKINSIQKSGPAHLEFDEVDEMLYIGENKIKEIIKLIESNC